MSRHPGRLALAPLAVLALGGCAGLASRPDWDPHVELVGNTVLSPAEVDRVVGPWFRDFEEDGWRKSAIDDAAYVLEEHYHDLGFPFARVTYDILGEGDRARVLVEEGPRIRLAGIEVRGDAGEEAEPVLLHSLGMADPGASPPYAPGRVRRAARDLVADLRLRGFLDARVRVEDAILDADAGSARAVFDVHRGVSWWLEEVRWSGDDELPEPIRAVLRGYAAGALGDVYTPRLRETLRRGVLDALRNNGYADATVEAADVTVLPGGAVQLTLGITPGVEVRLEGVRFVGNARTDAGLLAERLALSAGAPYDARALDEGLRRLYALGVFAEVRARLEPADGPRRTLVVEVRELSSLEVYVEPGYGAYETARVRAGIIDRNVFGRGRTLRADAGVSLRSVEAELGYSMPLFLDDATSADAVVKFEQREEPSFEFRELGLDLGVSRSWTSTLSSRLTYSLRGSDLLSSKVGALPAGTLADYDLSAVELATTFDTRDSTLDPGAGMQTRLSFEVASEVLASEVDFLRGVWNHVHYRRLGSRTVLAARLRAGVVAPIGTTDSIPLQERFFLGGENSIRSFRESELGPKDLDGDPVGGEAMSLASIELRRRLAGRFEGAVFAETGNVLVDRTDLLRFDGYRHALGVGLRYVLPVGPLRVDLGVNPNPRVGEDRYVVLVSVGRPY